MPKSSMVRISEDLERELKELHRRYCIEHGTNISFTEFTQKVSVTAWLRRRS